MRKFIKIISMKKEILIAAIILFTISNAAQSAGFILVNQPATSSHKPGIQTYALQCKQLLVQVDINCMMAHTKIEQVFINNTNSRLEGYFYFPVPKGSVISNFSMDVNGVMTQAELLDAGKARDIYEDIVRSMKDPALLEYAGQDLFRVRIFPIEPKSTKEIHISYRENVQSDNKTYMYRFPMNTKKYASAPLKKAEINIDVKCTEELKNVFSPTHDVAVTRNKNKEAKIRYTADDIMPDTDFKVYYQTGASVLGASCLSYKNPQDEGFFYLDIHPGLMKDENVLPKDITFVLDVSGSMNGEKMTQAKNALSYCIKNLNPADRFEIIRFSTEAKPLFGKRMAVNEDSKTTALQFIQSLKAVGGTNMDEALNMALKEKTESNRPSMIMFITDGKPTIGETEENALLKKISYANKGKHRVFTLGIGHDLNARLLDLITEDGKGYRAYIGEGEDIESEVSSFFQKVNSPVASDITIRFENSTQVSGVFPKQIPDLFRGESITLFGRFMQPGKNNLIIEGTVNGSKKSFTLPVELKEGRENEFIAPLWASRHVGYLLEQIRLHGETKELKDEVVLLAREYGIITPYTSYLIIEDERQQVEQRNMTLPIFSSRADVDELREKTKKDYTQMKNGEGEGAIQSSVQIQDLNRATTISQSKKSNSTMSITGKSGNTTNIAEETKQIGGRAWYNTNGTWVDIKTQNQKYASKIQIKFGSKEYFEFSRKYPEANDYLALGTNIRFIHRNVLVEINE